MTRKLIMTALVGAALTLCDLSFAQDPAAQPDSRLSTSSPADITAQPDATSPHVQPKANTSNSTSPRKAHKSTNRKKSKSVKASPAPASDGSNPASSADPNAPKP